MTFIDILFYWSFSWPDAKQQVEIIIFWFMLKIKANNLQFYVILTVKYNTVQICFIFTHTMYGSSYTINRCASSNVSVYFLNIRNTLSCHCRRAMFS